MRGTPAAAAAARPAAAVEPCSSSCPVWPRSGGWQPSSPGQPPPRVGCCCRCTASCLPTSSARSSAGLPRVCARLSSPPMWLRPRSLSTTSVWSSTRAASSSTSTIRSTPRPSLSKRTQPHARHAGRSAAHARPRPLIPAPPRSGAGPTDTRSHGAGRERASRGGARGRVRIDAGASGRCPHHLYSSRLSFASRRPCARASPPRARLQPRMGAACT